MKKAICNKKYILVLIFVCCASHLNARIVLPHVLSDGMVLQQSTHAAIWGKTDSQDDLTITTSWNNKSYKVTPAANGEWIIKVATPAASLNTYSIEIKSGEEVLNLKNIYIGEVWLCSGQSNMVTPVKNVINAEKELLDAEYDQIRFFEVGKHASLVPVEDVIGEWLPSSKKNTAGFSATAFFFAKNLYKQLKIPIGIIHTAYGSSTQEAWLSEESIRGVAYAERMLKHARNGTLNENVKEQKTPTGLYYGMFKPLVPCTVKGVCWYQGAGNKQNPDEYEQLLKNFIFSWRKELQNPGLPFILVQLTGFQSPFRYGWVKVQETQYTISKTDKNIAAVMTYDLGDPKDAHPKNKQDFGYRMSLAARKLVYNEKSLLAQGPELDQYKTAGDKVRISFKNTGSGLKSPHGKNLNNFQLAGSDQVFHPAKAVVVDKNTVEVSAPLVKAPLYVRYAFDSYNPDVNFYNSAGLPAVPFRTDTFDLDYKLRQTKK